MYVSINNKPVKNADESPACKMLRKITNKLVKVQLVDVDDLAILKTLPAETLIQFGNDESVEFAYTAGQLVEACETCNKVNFAEIEKLESQIVGLRESVKRHTQPVEIMMTHFAVNAPAEKKEKKGKTESVKVNPFADLFPGVVTDISGHLSQQK